jgi:anti-sigma factor ChrR (cupin superfamily)
MVCGCLAGCGGGDGGSIGSSAPDERAGTDVGLRDRLKKAPKRDEASVRQMLEGKGASSDEAGAIVELLSTRLTPDEMHVWLSDPKKSHPVPDPEFAKKMEDAGLVGGPMDWTAVNAIAAGKTQLVIDEAQRFAADG